MAGADESTELCPPIISLLLLKAISSKYVRISVTRKKLPNVYKSCPKMISQEKLMTLTHLQILPKNVRDLDKLIVSKGFKK